LFEINQSWDWNEYWTNAKYLDEPEYKTSCQPSVVYKATLDLNKLNNEILLTPIGHGHYSGKTGELFTDLTTITSAMKIAKKISVSVRK
jgi:polyphosphate kinase